MFINYTLVMETINLAKYEVGEWIPEIRRYKYICQQEACGIPFAGILGEKYCDDPCRWKIHNDKKRKTRLLLKRKREIQEKLEAIRKNKLIDRKNEIRTYLIRKNSI